MAVETRAISSTVGRMVEVADSTDSPAPCADRATGKRKPIKLDLGHVTDKNIGQLKKLNTATFPVHYKDSYYEALLKNLDYCRLGYCADVLACSICCRVEDRPEGGKALYIMTLSVLEAYQRRTLASQLMQWVVDMAESPERKADDLREVFLHVQTSNEGALNFYKGFGFKVTETIKNYYNHISPPDCFVIRKPLNGASLAEVADAGNTN